MYVTLMKRGLEFGRKQRGIQEGLHRGKERGK